jgi:hypothetical protein
MAAGLLAALCDAALATARPDRPTLGRCVHGLRVASLLRTPSQPDQACRASTIAATRLSTDSARTFAAMDA